MATAIVSILLTFILTGLVANWLAQRWQHRNWLAQQQFLGEEKEYVALKELCEQLADLTSKRLWRMRRLYSVLNRPGDEIVLQRLAEYDATVSEWNERFNSMHVRLTLLATWKLAHHLEHRLQKSFRATGSKLENMVKARLKARLHDAAFATNLDKELNLLSRQMFSFNRDVLRAVEEQRARTYYGVEIEFNKSNLSKFGNWELLKALFKPRMKSFAVTRSASHLRPPIIARD